MKDSLSVEEMKLRVAEFAAELVKSFSVIGLGSGTTVSYFVKCLAEKRYKGQCVPSSNEIGKLAKDLGLNVVEIDEVEEIEVTVDGADEVDPCGNLIKGYGGALLGEKILAKASEKYIIIVDERKEVSFLGERGKLPVEVVRYGWKWTKKSVEELLGKAKIRGGKDPYVTDHGHYILDVQVERIENPGELEALLNEIPGVVENGIFSGIADEIIISKRNGEIERKFVSQGLS